MASDILHIKDGYFFEVPRMLWRSTRKTASDFPSWFVRLDSEFQSAEADAIITGLTELGVNPAELTGLKELWQEWQHADHKNAGWPLDAYLEKQGADLKAVASKWSGENEPAATDGYQAYLAENPAPTYDWFVQVLKSPEKRAGWNKLTAKIASSSFKPDGLTVVLESGKAAFLRPLPAGAIHGVGKVTEAALARAGLVTVGDIQDCQDDLRAYVGSWWGELRRMAFGEDDRPLDFSDDIRSVSSENTFARDTADRAVLRGCLREQAEEIAGRLQRHRLAAVTVQVKVRYSDFTTLTRQVSMEEALEDASSIYRLSCWLLGRHRLVARPLRLIGVGVTGLRAVTMRQLVLPFMETRR
jgi:hypothetical protein